MTQTPASAPFGPVTTPPMSSASMATSFAGCCARDVVKNRDVQNAPAARARARRRSGLGTVPPGGMLARRCHLSPACYSVGVRLMPPHIAVTIPAATLPDEEVVARVLAGETGLFEVLMRRHNQRVYRAARAILRDDREAEDVMQEAYVNAYTHLD